MQYKAFEFNFLSLQIYVCSTSPDRPGDLKESFDVECLDGDFVSTYYIIQSMKQSMKQVEFQQLHK